MRREGRVLAAWMGAAAGWRHMAAAKHCCCSFPVLVAYCSPRAQAVRVFFKVWGQGTVVS